MALAWSHFPVEIHLQIIGYLDRSNCKKMRMTDKRNAASAECRLFCTIHLTPNARSFDRARKIASSPKLARHVRSIVYHVGILANVHNGFQTFRDDIMRLHSPSGSIEEITEDILWKYHCFLEEIDGQQHFARRNEFEELNFLCRRFKSLESITTILDEGDPFTPPQDFIGLRTGVQSIHSGDGPHFSSIFNAAANKRLTHVCGWSISWRCLSLIAERGLKTVDLNNMSKLALGLFNSEYLELEADERSRALEALDSFLQASQTSTNHVVMLDFDEIPFESEGEDLQEISEVVLKHQWPSLKHMALEGIVAQEGEIVAFLKKHSTSLKILHLDDIYLEDEVFIDGSGVNTTIPGSVITLFQQINGLLTLDSATISGCFTNRYDESWSVDLEHKGESCLRRDIEQWLTRKAPSPFSIELLTSERKTKEQIQDVTRAEDGPVGCDMYTSTSYPAAKYCDESWIWDIESQFAWA